MIFMDRREHEFGSSRAPRSWHSPVHDDPATGTDQIQCPCAGKLQRLECSSLHDLHWKPLQSAFRHCDQPRWAPEANVSTLLRGSSVDLCEDVGSSVRLTAGAIGFRRSEKRTGARDGGIGKRSGLREVVVEQTKTR